MHLHPSHASFYERRARALDLGRERVFLLSIVAPIDVLVRIYCALGRLYTRSSGVREFVLDQVQSRIARELVEAAFNTVVVRKRVARLSRTTLSVPFKVGVFNVVFGWWSGCYIINKCVYSLLCTLFFVVGSLRFFFCGSVSSRNAHGCDDPAVSVAYILQVVY